MTFSFGWLGLQMSTTARVGPGPKKEARDPLQVSEVQSPEPSPLPPVVFSRKLQSLSSQSGNTKPRQSDMGYADAVICICGIMGS